MRKGGRAIRKRLRRSGGSVRPASVNRRGRPMPAAPAGFSQVFAHARAAVHRGVSLLQRAERVGVELRPAVQLLLVHLHMELHRQVRADCKGLVGAGRAAGQQRGARRQIEGLLVPLQHRSERTVTEPMPRLAAPSCRFNACQPTSGASDASIRAPSARAINCPPRQWPMTGQPRAMASRISSFGAAQRRQRVVGTHFAAQDGQRRVARPRAPGRPSPASVLRSSKGTASRQPARWPGRPGRRR